MRIVGGQWRGRHLATPKHSGLRPTSERVREAVFDILAHGAQDFSYTGARTIDLFAGTGALGLEALSRGAAFCLFIDIDAHARGLIRANIEALGLGGITKVFRRDATQLGPAGNRGGYTLAVLDPPYGGGFGEKALLSLHHGQWLASGAVVVLEERADISCDLPPPFAPFDRRIYGDTQVLFGRFVP
ncbi:MAG: 16S rRNA (guanine(966)-N(2))-methyltransferase RsmD [Hyphomicrobiaceae bacterium]